MADSVTYRVVLVPAEQTSEEGCQPGMVSLTGTPGAGDWESWGPYRCVGELTAELAALGFGVPLPSAAPDLAVPSASV
jgi:hypothetical protein